MKISELFEAIDRLASFAPRGISRYDVRSVKKKIKLPGDSGLTYGTQISGSNTQIYIFSGDKPVGELKLSQTKKLGNKAYYVEWINVDPDFTGGGVAKSLYGVAMKILGYILVAGDSQSPGGRRNWASLSKIPGCAVKGFVIINDKIFDTPKKSTNSFINKHRENQSQSNDKIVNQLMDLGFEHINPTKSGYSNIKGQAFQFDVVPGKGDKEVKAYVKNKLSTVYTDSSIGNFDYNSNFQIVLDSGLFAYWEGS